MSERFDNFYEWQGDNLIICVYVQPKASKNEFCAVHGNAIKVRITAPPVDGKANQLLLKFFAKNFSVPRSHVQLLTGESGRRKRVCILSPQKLPEFISPPKPD